MFSHVRQLVAGFARIRTASCFFKVSRLQLNPARVNDILIAQNCFKNRKSPLYKSRMSVMP